MSSMNPVGISSNSPDVKAMRYEFCLFSSPKNVLKAMFGSLMPHGDQFIRFIPNINRKSVIVLCPEQVLQTLDIHL